MIVAACLVLGPALCPGRAIWYGILSGKDSATVEKYAIKRFHNVFGKEIEAMPFLAYFVASHHMHDYYTGQRLSLQSSKSKARFYAALELEKMLNTFGINDEDRSP